MSCISANTFVNSVVRGDCLMIMETLPPHSVDMVLCDLPYGTTQNKWDSILPLDDYIDTDEGRLTHSEYMLYAYKSGINYEIAGKHWAVRHKNGLWSLYRRVLKSDGVIVLTSNGRFTSQLIGTNPSWFKYRWIWVKSKATNFLNAKKQPLRKYEEICVFYRQQPIYNPQMMSGEAYDKGIRKNQLTGSYGDFSPRHVVSDGDRYPVDVVYFKTAESEGEVLHPTQKPVELGRYFIRTYTNPGDVVLDNTCGSGSFLVAALLEGRNFIGIELGQDTQLFKKQTIDYVNLSEKRLLDAWIGLSPEKAATIQRVNLFAEEVNGHVANSNK